MSQVTTHAPGTFCWPELVTTDSTQAKAFYATLFGWSYADQPIGGGQVYTMAQIEGSNVGALYEMGPDMRDQGIPSHWGSYVSVADVDGAAEKARGLGAKVVMDPMDVFEAGRMATLQDPVGAYFSLWQPRAHIGVERVHEPGALAWTELMTTDVAAAERFYTSLFGWHTDKESYAQLRYTVFMTGDQAAGGMMAITEEMGPIPPNWLVYFAVRSRDETVATARGAGGELPVPVMDIPEVGRIAVIKDPGGAVFGIIESTREQA